MKALRPDNRVILYANRNYWLNVDTTSYAGDGLWIADYVTAGKPRIQATWRFHQYTDDPVDTNVADFASKAALRQWADGAWGLSGGQDPAPEARGPLRIGLRQCLGDVLDARAQAVHRGVGLLAPGLVDATGVHGVEAEVVDQGP